MRLRSAGLLAMVLALLGCSGQGESAAPAPSAAAPSEAAEDVVGAPAKGVVVEADVRGVPTRLVVGPVVRDGPLALLRVSAQVLSGEESLAPYDAFGFTFRDIGRRTPDNLRLVDPDGLTVALTASTDDGTRAVDSPGQVSAEDGPVAFHPVFAAPEGDTVSVLIPLVGLVEDVPVVDPEQAAAAGVERSVADVADEIGATPADLDAPVHPLESYRELASGAVRARSSQEEVEVAVDSDVLFATDADTLSPEADAALRAALEQVVAYPAGALSVVGHTDDVADGDYNQDLSERRGAAVQARLGQLTDLTRYQVTVEGKGESEPAAEGTSEQARAVNRRVELVFTPSGEAPTDTSAGAPGTTGLPEPTGPVGSVAAGVEVARDDADDVARVRVEEVRAVGDLLVGTLTLERVSGSGTLPWLVSRSAFDSRGAFSPDLQYAATGVTLLVGDERVFPLDYAIDPEDAESREPLADLSLIESLAPGRTLQATVVWPGVATDEVVLDVPPITRREQVLGGYPWRIPGVPVRR